MSALEYANQAADVFVLPDAVTRIKDLIDDDSTSMQDIAEVVNFDPALMAQILRVANSALYNFPRQIDTVSKAVQVIGSNAIYDLVVAYGVSKAFGAVDSSVIELDKFWEQSVSCALLCKYFAEKLGCAEPERMFVAGLLHNVGELIMVQFNPDIAKKCSEFNEEQTPLKLQMQHLSASYSDIGSTLLRMWGLPESIANPIAKQHFSVSDANTLDEKIIQLSYILALDNANEAFYPAHANLEPMLYERLSLEPQELEAALDLTNLQSMSVLALFNPGSSTVY